MAKNRYGFLFNHDAEHQVAHIAPIMGALRNLDPGGTIVAMVSSPAQAEAVDRLLGSASSRNIEIKVLKIPGLLQWLFWPINKVLPAQRVFILKRYRDFFSTLDCLVVPEMTSSLLKTRFKLRSTPLILFPHGAGDRAIGFCQEIREFDYVLLAGSKTRDRMLREGLIRSDNHEIVGYPKFDTVSPLDSCQKTRLFDNENLTVLYNPHFDPGLSSWYGFGIDVLEFFAQRPHLNLVVAPHVMLFKKRVHFSLQSHKMRFRKSIPARYFEFPNILIDTGSAACVDMTYTLNADVYMGDASSQVYEFLTKPRPCIFLNDNNPAWKDNDNFRHWTLGPVIDSLSSLEHLLSQSVVALQHPYRDLQLQAANETFDLNGIPSSSRAAQAVLRFLERNPRAVPKPARAINAPVRPAFKLGSEFDGVIT